MSRPPPAGPSALTREAVLAALDELWELYEAAAPEFFDAFTTDASFFSASAPLRIAGRQEYRRLFGPNLGAQRRATHTLHPEVRLLGDGAVVTAHARIRVNYGSVDQCMTVVVVRAGGRLKVAHLHMSPLVSPAAPEAEQLVEEIIAIPAADEPAGRAG